MSQFIPLVVNSFPKGYFTTPMKITDFTNLKNQPSPPTEVLKKRLLAAKTELYDAEAVFRDIDDDIESLEKKLVVQQAKPLMSKENSRKAGIELTTTLHEVTKEKKDLVVHSRAIGDLVQNLKNYVQTLERQIAAIDESSEHTRGGSAKGEPVPFTVEQLRTEHKEEICELEKEWEVERTELIEVQKLANQETLAKLKVAEAELEEMQEMNASLIYEREDIKSKLRTSESSKIGLLMQIGASRLNDAANKRALASMKMEFDTVSKRNEENNTALTAIINMLKIEIDEARESRIAKVTGLINEIYALETSLDAANAELLTLNADASVNALKFKQVQAENKSLSAENNARAASKAELSPRVSLNNTNLTKCLNSNAKQENTTITSLAREMETSQKEDSEALTMGPAGGEKLDNHKEQPICGHFSKLKANYTSDKCRIVALKHDLKVVKALADTRGAELEIATKKLRAAELQLGFRDNTIDAIDKEQLELVVQLKSAKDALVSVQQQTTILVENEKKKSTVANTINVFDVQDSLLRKVAHQEEQLQQCKDCIASISTDLEASRLATQLSAKEAATAKKELVMLKASITYVSNQF